MRQDRACWLLCGSFVAFFLVFRDFGGYDCVVESVGDGDLAVALPPRELKVDVDMRAGGSINEYSGT